jgi:peptidoglycan hydrolase-like protein with peptidoglycan-binding domain
VPSTIETVIIDSARRHGVDPYLAVAIATVESRLDPHAVGDNGTSFGLFQLHKGGELGDLTPEEAKDPRTNADVALTEVARVLHAHPLWSPGEIAAAAQRPLHGNVYAAGVNALVGAMAGPHYCVLWRYLQLADPFERGTDVRALQFRLSIAPDGVFGPVTLAHVQSFQSSHGLTDDGIVGPKTCAALGWHWDG